MEFSRKGRSGGMVAGVCGLLLMTAACSPEKPDVPKATRAPVSSTMPDNIDFIKCNAQSPEAWSPTPTNINADFIAQMLQTTPDRIRAGRFGAAVCQQAAAYDDIYQTGVPAEIEGIGPQCLVIGIAGERPPEPGKSYHNVIAVCAALKP